MKRGLLIMEFSHKFGASDITIYKTFFVELKPLIQDLNETLPYDATFQAVALQRQLSNKDGSRTIDRLLLTTGRFHTLQLALTFDKGSLTSTVI
jgi:hypothetical protein